MLSRSKIFFTPILLLLIQLVFYIPFFYEQWQEFQRSKSEFLECLELRDHTLAKIKQAASNDPQDESRAELIQDYFDESYLPDYLSLLKSGNQKLPPLPKALESGVGVFLGKKGRVQEALGDSYSDLLGKNWFKEFLISLKMDGKLWIQRQALFAMPPGYSDFLSRQRSWNWTLRSSKAVYINFTRWKRYQILVVVQPDKVSTRNYEKLLDLSLRTQFSSLGLSLNSDKHDEVQLLGLRIRKIHSVSSFHYKLDYRNQDLRDLLNYFLLSYLCLLAGWYLLRRSSYFRFLGLRFTPRFVALWIVYCSLFLFVFEIFWFNTLQGKRRELIQDWEKLSVNQILQLESRYWDWLQNFVDFLKNEEVNEDFFTSLRKNEINYAYYRADNSLQHEIFSANMAIRQFLFKNGVRNLLFHPYYGMDQTRKLEEILPVFHQVHNEYKLTEIASIYSPTDLHLKSLDEILIKSSASEKVSLSSLDRAQAYRIVDFEMDAFSRMIPPKDELSKPELVIATISRDDGVRKFFQSTPEQFEDSYLFYFSRSQQDLIALNSESESFQKQAISIYNRLSNSLSPFEKVQLNNRIFYALLQPSTVVGGAGFLLLSPESQILKELQNLRKSHHRFLTLYFVLGSLSLLYLIINVLVPANRLRRAMAIWRNGQTPEPTRFLGWHEGARLTSHFDQFLVELEQRDKMLPFLSRSLLKLLDHKKESYKAVILFSDIQGFTSFSEVHDSQEVVDMLNDYFSLWETAGERYGAVTERYVGDAVQSLFFEALDKNFIQSAIECALKLKSELVLFNERRIAESKAPVQCGIALKLGNIRLEVIGNEIKKEFFSYSQEVFECEEMEKFSREGKYTQIVVDDSILDEMKHFYDFESFEVNGFEGPLHEVKADIHISRKL